jgi:uncharacterized protein (DUF1330 family)
MYMKTRYAVTLAMLAGAAIGAVAVHGLHAQAKPQAYVITEIDVTNSEAYSKEYVPLATASIKAFGGHPVAAGGLGAGRMVSLEGQPPKGRVVVNLFDSIEKAQEWRNSTQYKEGRKIGDKYATYRAFAVEAAP